jgi:Holliday junction resolvase RusA-like endonuclease
MRGKYPTLLPSKQYLQFEKNSLPYLYRVKQEVGVVNYPVNIQCIFYMDARRKVDLSNLLNAVDDAMVKSGLILDDNRDIIAGHDGSRVYHDKDNPRIELEINELKDYVQWKDTKNTQTSLF